jgi:succinyl-diaminopimelate desuccinylase
VTADSLASLLENLVDIPSETGQEAAITEWLLARLRRVRGGEILRSGQSLVWRAAATGKPLVVLAGHVDTVPAQNNGRAARRDGRVYGLGSTDMKGGDAVMLGLLDTIDPLAARFDLAFVFYEAEEGPSDHNGLKRLLGEMPWLCSAQLAILLEPTDLKVELGCIGAMNAEVKVRGKSAHSARPWLGVNAVAKAAPWLSEIVQFPVTPALVNGIEYRETLSVTTVKAGRARNVVPDEITFNLNYRFPPDRTIAQAEQRLRALVPAEFEFTVFDRAEPGRVCNDRPEVQEFITRFDAKVAGKQGWTDVAQFTAAGVPAFNFGPGIPELAHQADEYCPIPNLGTAYEWLRSFVMASA